MLSFINILFTMVNIFLAISIYFITHEGSILLKEQKQLISQQQKVDKELVLIKANIEYLTRPQVLEQQIQERNFYDLHPLSVESIFSIKDLQQITKPDEKPDPASDNNEINNNKTNNSE